MRFDVTVISSGSKGNAVLVKEAGEAKGILIDCGVPYNTIKPYEKHIDIILLTHRHKDHWRGKTLEKLKASAPNHLLIYPEGLKIDYDGAVAAILPHKKWATLKSKYRVMCIPTPHSVPNVAWVIKFLNGGVYFHATDTSSLNHISVKGADVYALECNYTDTEELAGRGVGNEVIAATTHLSTEDALAWYNANKGEHSILIPLHEHKIFN